MESLLSLATSSFSVEVKNLADLKRIAVLVARACRGGERIYLSGPLGAGKTTFVQMLAGALGVTTIVNSPSFLIVKEYAIPHTTRVLVHADAYRVESLDDLKSTGLLDLIGASDVISVIEWPERVSALEPYLHLHITFTITGTKRTVSVALHGEDLNKPESWKGIFR